MGMGSIYHYNTTIKTPMEPWTDPDGKVWISAIAHTTLTAKTPYKIILDEYGYVTQALSSTGPYVWIGVPPVAGTSGAKVKLQIGGDVDDMVTPSLSVSVGHALAIQSGTVADVGADFSWLPGEFAVCRTASTTSATQDVTLVPNPTNLRDPDIWRDESGKTWIKAVAHATLTAATPYFIIANENGRLTAAFSNVAIYTHIGVASAAGGVTNGATVALQIGGAATMTTASLAVDTGHAIKVNGGTTADVGADYTGAVGEFAIASVSTQASAVTTQTVFLVPERILTVAT